MDSTPGRKQLTHQRIVGVAAEALRRKGFEGVGVAEVMKDAGLTHGGFYAHFASRDALLCEALVQAGTDAAGRVQQAAARGGRRPASALRALVDNYLSEAHLAAPERGCPVAALVSEMPRQSDAVREVAAARVRALVQMVKQALPPAAAGEAAAVAAQLVGALQLARALGHTAEGRALLAATRRSLLARHEGDDGHAAAATLA